MLNMLTRNWWLFALRGVLAICFGILAIIWPQQTVLVLVLLFGAYALADGIFSLYAGIASHRYFERWWAELLEGVAGIGVGVLTFIWPAITTHVLLYLVAVWAVVTGIFEILAAIQLRRLITGEWALILSGLLSVVFGVLLFAYPAAGIVTLVWLVGVYAIAFGIMLIILAFRLRSLRHDFEKAIALGI